MKFALLLTTISAWALWFGGTIATFVFGLHFFAVLPRELAGEAASAMFHVFARYELVLAAITVLGTGLLLVTYPAKGFVFLLATLILASGMMITVALGFMPAMDALRSQGKQHTPEFIKIHGKSMITMTVQSGLLLISGGVIVATIVPARGKPMGRAFEVKLGPRRP